MTLGGAPIVKAAGRRARHVGLALLALSVLPGCFGRYRVTRVVDGEEQEGRFIEVRAYAAYARGAYLETVGDLDGARIAYDEAVRSDPKSPLLWTRLGAVRCKRGDPESAAAFARAEELDPELEPLARERARCAERTGRTAEAIAFAERAIALDPNRVESTLLLVELFEAAGRREDALRWLDALVVRHPSSRPAWRAMRDYAERHDHAGRSSLAVEALARLGALPLRSTSARGDAIDEALLDGDLDLARERALAARLPAAELAARAAAVGRTREALAQGTLVLQADPSNGTARVAVLVAADLAGDAATFRSALTHLADDPVPPSPLAARLMAELLERRADAEAAASWRAAFMHPETGGDARRESVPSPP